MSAYGRSATIAAHLIVGARRPRIMPSLGARRHPGFRLPSFNTQPGRQYDKVTTRDQNSRFTGKSHQAPISPLRIATRIACAVVATPPLTMPEAKKG